MKKTNMVLIGIFAVLLVQVFFASTVVAAYGSVYIYPDGDYAGPQWGPSGGSGQPSMENYWRVAEQTEENYIYTQLYPCLDKYSLSNPGLSNHYIPSVKMMVYAKSPGGRVVSFYMRIDGTTYKKTFNIHESSYSWYEFSQSCPSGYWSVSDINHMRCRVFAEYWDWSSCSISRIKVKVYWTTTPL